jgi:hypothetical protein
MLLVNKVTHGSMRHRFIRATRTEAAMKLFDVSTSPRRANANTQGRLQIIPATIQGVVQRLNYARRELRVIAQDRVWVFALPVDCDVYFNGACADLRCIHPLDPVTVQFECRATERIVTAVFGWEPVPTPPVRPQGSSIRSESPHHQTRIPMKSWLLLVAMAGVILLVGSGCAAEWHDEDEAVSAALFLYDLFEMCLFMLAMLVVASFVGIAAIGFIGHWAENSRCR